MIMLFSFNAFFVDDVVIIGDEHIDISKLKQCLSQQFEMKYLGRLSYFLGSEITSDISQLLSF